MKHADFNLDVDLSTNGIILKWGEVPGSKYEIWAANDSKEFHRIEELPIYPEAHIFTGPVNPGVTTFKITAQLDGKNYDSNEKSVKVTTDGLLYHHNKFEPKIGATHINDPDGGLAREQLHITVPFLDVNLVKPQPKTEKPNQPIPKKIEFSELKIPEPNKPIQAEELPATGSGLLFLYGLTFLFGLGAMKIWLQVRQC